MITKSTPTSDQHYYRTWVCLFCKQGRCDHCVIAARNVRLGAFPCRCTGCEHPVQCLDCKNTDPDEVSATEYRCLDPNDCRTRISERQKRNALYRMLQDCRAAGAASRIRIVRERDRIARNVPKDEEDSAAPRPKREPRPVRARVGECLCCGQPTKGGKFQPGHDAKLAAVLRVAHRDGTLTPEQSALVTELGWEKKVAR